MHEYHDEDVLSTPRTITLDPAPSAQTREVKRETDDHTISGIGGVWCLEALSVCLLRGQSTAANAALIANFLFGI
jgi:hypothetical protein